MIGIYDINQNSNLTYKQRLDIYKSVGFKEIALYIDDNYNNKNENYISIINYAKKIGMQINQVHVDYKISNLICDENTNDYFEYISKKLKEAEKLSIPYVVAHASMSDNPPEISDSQLDKFKTMMLEIKDKNVTLCLENVRNNNNLKRILNLNLPNVKMCFDLGHAHCYGNEKEIFKEFKSQIICSHLHNNFGKDTHNLLNDGEIDYKYFLQKLSQIKNISNCLECFPEWGKILNEEEFINFIKCCYNTINN